MKRLYSKLMCNKKVILMGRLINLLGIIALATENSDLSRISTLYFYEPEEPENLKKVSKKDLLLLKEMYKYR